MRRPLCIVAGVLILGLPSSGVAAQKQFEEAVSVTLVEVPVHVSRNGRPLKGLVATDFELREDGRVREIIHFEALDFREKPSSAGRPRAESAAPVSGRVEQPSRRRHLVLLLDMLAEPSYLKRALKGMRRMVRRQLEPTDVAVVALSTTGGTRLLWGFSGDRDLLELQLDAVQALIDAEPARAVEVLAQMERAQERAAPNAFSVHELRTLAARVHNPFALGLLGDSSSGAYVEAESEVNSRVAGWLEPETSSLDPSAVRLSELEDPTVDQTLAAEEQLLDSIANLGRLLHNVPEPKYMVFFSGSRASALLQRIQTQARASGDLWGMTRTLNAAGWIVDTMDIEGVPATTRSGASVETTPEDFSSSTSTVGRVMGLRAWQHPTRTGFNADTLHAISADTGGRLYENFNSIGEATSRMLDASVLSYLLAFEPAPELPAGRFRRIEVLLRDPPPGAEIRHRRGYVLEAISDAD